MSTAILRSLCCHARMSGDLSSGPFRPEHREIARYRMVRRPLLWCDSRASRWGGIQRWLRTKDRDSVADDTLCEVGVWALLPDAVDVCVDEFVVEADEACDREGFVAGEGVGPGDVVDVSISDLCRPVLGVAFVGA